MERIDPAEIGDKVAVVIIEGEEVEVPFQELLQGYLRHGDYTKKTQALAEERKGVEGATKDQALALDLLRQYRANPAEAHARIGRQLGLDVPTPDPEGEGEEMPEGNAQLQQILDQLEAQNKEITRLQTRVQVDGETTELQKKYPDTDPEAVLAYAAQNGITTGNLEVAYRAMQFDSMKEKLDKQQLGEEEQKSALDEILGQKRGLPGSPAARPQQAAPPAKKPEGMDGFDWAMEQAAQELSE